MKYLSIALLFVASVANAQPAKDVVVVNEPLLVEVTNPSPTAPPARWQLVGFTSATYTGDMGGWFGVTQKCQLEFDDSRMCSQEEAALTTSIPTGLTGTARVPTDGGPHIISVININGNCDSWTTSAPQGTSFLISSIGTRIPGVDCDGSASIACCALVP